MDYRAWLNNERSIRDDTLATWNVSIDPDHVRFPYKNGAKVRGVDASQNRTFYAEGSIGLYCLDEPVKETVFIVEGETDTLRLYQELVDNGFVWNCSVVGLSGINGWKPEYSTSLSGAKKVFVILDNDPGYKERERADITYRSIREAVGRDRVSRIKLRADTKDVCEFFDKYSWATFIKLTEPSTATFYTPLDLTKDPTPYEWLLDNWICQGDVTLLIGEPNVGKSFISMGLALAVAQGQAKFLDQDVCSHGKVMYIDEENPEDVILHRLACMGLNSQGEKNLHYLHRRHIRLDKNPEQVLDDALIIKPKLIVIDSLTRVHNQNEIDAGAMNIIFNESIIPLARETGAAVVVLHHVGKTESNSSYNRSRGSSDIGAVIDNGIDIRNVVYTPSIGNEVECMNLVQYKSRRRSRIDKGMKVKIEDTITGNIELNRLDKSGNF